MSDLTRGDLYRLRRNDVAFGERDVGILVELGVLVPVEPDGYIEIEPYRRIEEWLLKTPGHYAIVKVTDDDTD